MQVSKAFRDHVLATALKGFRHDRYTGKIIPEINLTSAQIDSIVETAAASYGMPVPSETRQAVYSILNETDPFSGAPERTTMLRVDRISPGEIVELTHPDGATLSIIAVGDLQFRVLHDAESVLAPGDRVIPLSFTISCQSQLCLEVTRGNRRYPDDKLYYTIESVAAIAVTRNNISALTTWLDEDDTEDSAEVLQSLDKARAFNADFTGRRFFASSLVEDDCRTAIFELDLENMSVTLSHDFELDYENRHDAIIAEILRVCDCEGDNPFDNLHRIVCTSPGIIEIEATHDSEGTYDICIIQPPIVKQL